MNGLIRKEAGELTQDINHNELEMDRCLFDALYALMQRRTIDELTVSDILQKAHVSRSSFYRRYFDKYDLLIKSYRRLMENTFLLCMDGGSWKDSAVELYAVIMKHPQFFKHAFASRGPNSLKAFICETILDCIRERMRQADVSLDEDWRLLIAAQAYLDGTMEMTCRWAMEDMPYPADELIRLFCDIMPEMIKPYCL